VARLVFLDSGPLGYAAHRPTNPKYVACLKWIAELEAGGSTVVIPEIADYELRRNLILESPASVRRLDGLVTRLRYVPLTTPAMKLAAMLWADARRAGKPTADKHALDVDVILAAQARLAIEAGHKAIVATTNLKHLIQYVDADLWHNVR
jgi:predicted nucleic acid-binding protein